MADILSDHLFLAQFLLPELLCMVAQLRGDHRRSLQIAAEVFDVTPGSSGFRGDVNFTVTLIQSFQVTGHCSLSRI